MQLSVTLFTFQFHFWMEFVPLSEVKVRQTQLIEEWLQVESYQKTLASHTPKLPRDDGEESFFQKTSIVRTPTDQDNSLIRTPLNFVYTRNFQIFYHFLCSHDKNTEETG